jgi:uncharacterized membrane protein YdjX (TVP38/TMEM64 family)
MHGSNDTPPLGSAPEPEQQQEEEPQQQQGCMASYRRGLQRFRKIITYPEGRAEWAGCIVFWAVLVAMAATLFVVIFPRFVDNVINPLLAAMQRRLTPLQIAGICFVAHVILPMFLLLPYNWVAWLLGMVFPFWQALLIITAASAVGMSLQYLMARSFLHGWVERRLQADNNRRAQVLLRAVDMVGPWKFTFLLRIGPYPPYQFASYALAIPKCITFWIHFLVSVPAEVPGRALMVFFGQNLGTISDLLRGRVKDPAVVAYNIVSTLLG